jgi:hypothetical protein
LETFFYRALNLVPDTGTTLLNRSIRVGRGKGELLLSTQAFPKVNLIQPACALVFGNVADVYTTVQGLIVGNGEYNPVAAHFMSAYGLMGFVLCKIGIILALIGMVFLAAWLTEKLGCKPQDVYLARRFSHFGLWLSAACYIPIVLNNLITFYLKVHGSPM